ncbi:MAG TPA: coenzyme F420-0:L-glutamate ligase [Candidatus Nitrosotalea sp.]|nr:coenzyme F420-0:L-glutamate ligase [Candidatus Nitrosotalea sp.]
MSLTVLPIKSTLKKTEFDLFSSLVTDLENSDIVPSNGDVLVISSKYVANSQGRVLEYNKVVPSSDAEKIGKRFRMKPNMAEIILRESDVIFGGIPGFVITSSDNIMAPNAGIDKSNTENGTIVLYPNEPYLVAEHLRRKFILKYNVHIGIIIADSRLMPGRVGTVGVAISCAGIEPTSDLRGERDLYGKSLKVTFQAVADDLASIANLKMGEGADATPCVLIRNSDAKLTNRKIRENEMAISYEQCVYVRGLGMRI